MVRPTTTRTFRVRGILFSPRSYFLLGNFWGLGLLRASRDEILLSGPFHKRRVVRSDVTRLAVDGYRSRRPCLVFDDPTSAVRSLLFVLTPSDFAKTVPALVNLGWPVETFE